MAEQELADVLRRAGLRFAYHLARAGVEGLKAVTSVLDELGTLGADRPITPNPAPDVQRIEIE